ncbi:MAG TPA: DUF4439 domain-containing protein [Nocardioides sp.]|uniref:DUF4439 domain-containing protein n=1 Tax=Nocardioides sp. TaxID=35761 RepID=UPI002F3F8915
MSTPSPLEALQRTLAAEHASIFVLGALGGRASTLSSEPLRSSLTTAYDVHLQRRDRLRVLVRSAGAVPVAAEPAYRLPSRLTTAAQIKAEALRVERGCATTYAALVAATAGADRRWAVEALVATAVGEAAFGGRPEALPGLDT